MSISEAAPKNSLADPVPFQAKVSDHYDYFRIKPSTGWVSINLKEIWKYRELVYFFAWRDIKVRYKQTLLGAAWAIIQPVFTMIVFSLLFGRLAKMPSEGLPYPVFCFAA